MKQHLRLGFWHTASIAPLSAYFLTFSISPGLAQVVPDNTLGAERSQVNAIDALNDRIDGGALRSNSLFHSFQQFGIQTGHSASFSTPASVTNIFSRVTGNQPSGIDGKLGVLGDANLFLINPCGIIFGIGGSLDLKGSFIASTASNILFSNGSQFGTISPQSVPLLTVEALAPIGLQFEGKPSGISVARSATESFDLTVQPGKTLALIGGDIRLSGNSLQSGTLRAFGGRVELGGLAENGVVQLSNNLQDLQLTFPTDKIRSDVSLSNAAQVTTRSNNGGSISVHARNLELTKNSKLVGGINVVEPTSDAKAGNITIDATGKVILRDGSLIANDFDEVTQEEPTGFLNQAGDIQITADSLSLYQDSAIVSSTRGRGNAGSLVISANKVDSDRSYLLSTVGRGAIGNGGNIEITTGTLDVTDKSVVSVSVEGLPRVNEKLPRGASTIPGNGNAGRLTINASKSVNVNDSYILSALNKEATGAGGNIRINADALSLSNQALLSTGTEGNGDAGDIAINVSSKASLFGKGTAISSDVGLGAIGKGGTIKIAAGSLSLSNGSSISTGTEGEGDAGSIKINALGQTSLNNSTLFSSVNRDAIGKGGLIEVIADQLALENDAIISSGSEGVGNAGSLTINARHEVLVDKSRINSTLESGEGKGGDIRITTNSLTLTNNGRLEVSTEVSDGDAGSIDVNADFIRLNNRSIIQAKTQSGNGGDINLIVRKLLLVRNGSEISVTSGTEQNSGNGGNITVEAKGAFIVAVPRENSDITANAFSGEGGKIRINARAIFGLSPRSRDDLEILLGTSDPTKLNPNEVSTSDITAISQQNPTLNGEVNLNAAVNPNPGLNQVPKEPCSIDIADSCQVSNGKESVRFFDIGRGGLPPRPEDSLSLDLLEWAVSTPTSSTITVSSGDIQMNWKPTSWVTAHGLAPPCRTR
jgi:filamentous hemagglutinin family protein